MPGRPGSKGSAQFAAAARVLFESAKKAGVVAPRDDVGRKYAQQLQKIQSQSRKRGGSLGSVSYKIAEFLETQRGDPPAETLPLKPGVTIARKVPLIDIPGGEKSPRTPAVKISRPLPIKLPQVQVPSLDIPNVHRTKPKLPASDPANDASAAALSPANRPLLPDTEPLTLAIPLARMAPSPLPAGARDPRGDSEPVGAPITPFSTDSDRPAEFAIIEEDRPLFDFSTMSPTTAAVPDPSVSSRQVPPSLPPQRAAEVEVTPLPPRPTPKKAPHLKPRVVIPSLAMHGAGEASPAPDTSVSEAGVPLSVDVWEQQREREIEQLRSHQEEMEQQRLREQMEREHLQQGVEWVSQRSQEMNLKSSDREYPLLHKLYFSRSWEHALAALATRVTQSDSGRGVPLHAIMIASARAAAMPVAQRPQIHAKLLELLKSVKNLPPDVIPRFRLRQVRGEELVTEIQKLPESIKKHVDAATVRRAVPMYMRLGLWEEAIALVDLAKLSALDVSLSLDTHVISSSRLLTEQPAKEAIAEMYSKRLGEAGRLGRDQKLALAQLQTPHQRRSTLLQMSSSKDVDEKVFAELLRISPSDRITELLKELKAMGLNSEDPSVTVAICRKSVQSGDVVSVFTVIEEQSQKTGPLPLYASLAVSVARASPSHDTLRSALKVLKETPPANAKFNLRKLLPLLHRLEMPKEVVELYELYKDRVPILTALPNAVAYINSALVAEGREPLSNKVVSDLPSSTTRGDEMTEGARRMRSTSGSGEESLSKHVSAEVMLEYARERRWVEALEAVATLPQRVPDDEKGALTLLYNCALSAAVDIPDVTEELYNRMKERGVDMNATTTNTVMSSFSKTEDRWLSAVKIYQTSAATGRDTSTFSVMLSLFGKRNLWTEAMDVVSSAKAASPKPSPIVYSLGISAVHQHNWEITLRLFYDMLRVHGAGSIKESVSSRVIRSLEASGRLAEKQKVESELSKKKKKKA